jgi:hypothetical protein
MTAENYSRLASTHLRHRCRTAIGTRAQRLAGYCGYDNFYPGLGKLGRLRRCRCCLTDGCRRSEKKDNSRGPDVRVEIEDVQSKIKTGAR